MVPFYVEKIVYPNPNTFKLKITLKRCWLPRRCAYSGKLLWLRLAYLLETQDYDFHDLYHVYTWIDRDTYLVKKLRNEF